jgi:CRP-like cAMP-binding protein
MSLKTVFTRLSDEELAQVDAIGEARDFATGGVLIAEGIATDEMFLIEAGTVRINKRAWKDSADLAVIHPGQVLGEVSFIDDGPPSATAIAASPVKAIVWSKTRLRELAAQHPVIGARIYHSLALRLAARLRDTSDRHASLQVW